MYYRRHKLFLKVYSSTLKEAGRCSLSDVAYKHYIVPCCVAEIYRRVKAFEFLVNSSPRISDFSKWGTYRGRHSILRPTDRQRGTEKRISRAYGILLLEKMLPKAYLYRSWRMKITLWCLDPSAYPRLVSHSHVIFLEHHHLIFRGR